MSFWDSDQKSMPVVGFLTHNGSGIFCRPKLIYRGGLDTELISCLQCALRKLKCEVGKAPDVNKAWDREPGKWQWFLWDPHLHQVQRACGSVQEDIEASHWAFWRILVSRRMILLRCILSALGDYLCILLTYWLQVVLVSGSTLIPNIQLKEFFGKEPSSLMTIHEVHSMTHVIYSIWPLNDQLLWAKFPMASTSHLR